MTGDVRDAAAVARAVRGVDSVCHLAYLNGTEVPSTAYGDLAGYIAANS